MPRYQTLPKTLHGQPVSQQDFIKAITDALTHCEEQTGSAGHLAGLLGPEYLTTEGKALVLTSLKNMERRDLVRRVERGIYKLAPHVRRAGVSSRHQMEMQVIDILRKDGGFARRRDIQEEFDVRPAGPEFREAVRWLKRADAGLLPYDEAGSPKAFNVHDVRDTYVFKLIHTTISESKQLYTVIGEAIGNRGIIHLDFDEIARLPVRGRWMARLVKYEVYETRPRAQRNSWMVERDLRFRQIGEAFQTIRDRRGIELADLARSAKVKKALNECARSRWVRPKLFEGWYMETEAEARLMEGRGVPAEEIGAFREERMQDRYVVGEAVRALTLFESGFPDEHEIARGALSDGVNVHLNMPVAFYVEAAKVLEVDAAQLSRGIILPTLESAHYAWVKR
jgi:hypothetical protein